MIADVAEAWYICRIRTRRELETPQQRILKCAPGAAIATETQYEAKIITGTHELTPNEKMARLLYRNLELIGPPLFDAEEQKFAEELQKAYQVQPLGLSSKIVPPTGRMEGGDRQLRAQLVRALRGHPDGLPAHRDSRAQLGGQRLPWNDHRM